MFLEKCHIFMVLGLIKTAVQDHKYCNAKPTVSHAKTISFRAQNSRF